MSFSVCHYSMCLQCPAAFSELLFDTQRRTRLHRKKGVISFRQLFCDTRGKWECMGGGAGNLSFFKAVLEFYNNLWGLRNRVGLGLSYRPVRLYRLAESIPWNPFLDSLKVQKFRALNKMKKVLDPFLLVSEITDDSNLCRLLNLYNFGVYRCLTSLRLCWRYLRLSSLVSMASTLASNPAICSGIFSRSCTASSACPPWVVRGCRVVVAAVVMSEKGVVPRLVEPTGGRVNRVRILLVNALFLL